MANGELNPLQLEFLRAFFQRRTNFFLTGGAALTGFYLHHRNTEDLDLFTVADSLTEGMRTVADVARELGGTLEPIQSSPDFHRILLRRGNETVIIDLIREYTPQAFPKKQVIAGVTVDPPGEILANKLCALLSRSEVRDIVDVRALELAGYRVEDWLGAAHAKDSGLTPAQLSWVLGEVKFGADLVPPGSISVDELRQYLADLVGRLAKLGFPHPDSGPDSE